MNRWTPILARLLLTAVPVLLQANDATGQELRSSDLSPGDRVRVTVAPTPPQTGTLVSAAGETLRWIPEASSGDEGNPLEAAIPMSAIARLEKSVGTEARYKRTILFTSLATAAVGGTLSALTHESSCHPEETVCKDNRTAAFVLGALGGIALGVPAGAVIASNRKRDIWQEVTKDQAMAYLGLTSSGQFGLTLSLPLRR